MQFFYTGWFLKFNNSIKTFLFIILFFSLVGLLVSILFIIFNAGDINFSKNNVFIWIIIITLVFEIYGGIYWLLNYIIKKKIKNSEFIKINSNLRN